MLASGMTLRAICRRQSMPHERTVRGWALDLEHPFFPQYDRARLIGYHSMSDEIIDITDDSTNDYVERQNKDGSSYTVVDHDHIARSRLRVDTRKWLLSKALPKVFGDKLVNEHTGKDGGPIETADATAALAKDHLDGLSKRYANGLKVISGGAPAKANGKGH